MVILAVGLLFLVALFFMFFLLVFKVCAKKVSISMLKGRFFYKTAYVVGHMWTSLIVNLVTVVLLPGKKILGAYLLVKSFQILGGLMIRRR